MVDQFRYDYLTRFGDLFGTHGIGRLMREGASWTNANFDHSATLTAPGHAVFLTGAWPSQTGIIANEWYERDTGKKVKSITDDGTLTLAGKPGPTVEEMINQPSTASKQRACGTHAGTQREP